MGCVVGRGVIVGCVVERGVIGGVCSWEGCDRWESV